MDLTIIYHILEYFLIGVGIGIGIYYAQFTLPFINWLRGGIENQDGKLENKDLQIGFISVFVGFIIFTSYLGTTYSDSLIWGSFGTLAGLYGIKEIFGKKNGED